MANLNDFASRFRKGLSNPFLASGRDWCPRCAQDVDTETAHAHRGSIYGYRRRCRRCGDVIANGLHDNVVLLTKPPIGGPAVQWAEERGADRR